MSGRIQLGDVFGMIEIVLQAIEIEYLYIRLATTDFPNLFGAEEITVNQSVKLL